MTYNLTKIMNDAWARFRSLPAERLEKMTAAARRCRFAHCLRMAWNDAKFALAQTMPRKPLSEAESLAARANDMENRTRLGISGIEKLSRLRTALYAAIARENAQRAFMGAADLRAAA